MRTRSPTSRNKDAKEDSEIYVGNINAQTPVEPEDLKRLFSIAGQVNNVRIEKSNSKDTHFAFITFHTVDEAEQGCLYDGFKYHALSLKVQRKGRPGPPKLAQPPSEDFTQKLRELQERENTDLYLTNLNTADASEEVLHETFSAFGDVRRVRAFRLLDERTQPRQTPPQHTTGSSSRRPQQPFASRFHHLL